VGGNAWPSWAEGVRPSPLCTARATLQLPLTLQTRINNAAFHKKYGFAQPHAHNTPTRKASHWYNTTGSDGLPYES